ncbi:MAG: glycosyltransferase, partial [Methyloprofundus sp.]|nr:glycosyltransferase [Methyloprofundus sp.]
NSLFSTATQIVTFVNKVTYHKKIIIAPRGELQDNALEIKKTKKNIYLFCCQLLKLHKDTHFHSTDVIETHRIKSIFSDNQVSELANAVKVHQFKPLSKKENQLKLIFISRISKKKNLDYAIKILHSVKSHVQMDIYGPTEDTRYWHQCLALIKKLPANIQVHYKGSLGPEDVMPTMRQYHAFFLPTKSENFGHVIVEAMQSGLIPVISNQTPWINLEDNAAGWDIALSDENKFIQLIETLYRMNDKIYTEFSESTIKYIHKQLNSDLLEERYINFFNNVINEA